MRTHHRRTFGAASEPDREGPIRGFDVAVAATGPEAIESFEKSGADLILLDLMLPGLSGTEVCRQIRNEGIEVGVLFLSAKDEMKDKVQGLTIGGDDYMTKPFSIEELVLRVKAILRRTSSNAATSKHLQCGPITMDLLNRKIIPLLAELK